MKLSLLYFTCVFLFILLSQADQTDLNPNTCPTSRHLLFFGGFNFPLGEKKSEHISSSSKSSSSSSSPPKYARTDNKHGLTVYIRPQTSSELGQKVRSYSHLLKPKLFTNEERTKLKKIKSGNKKTKIHKPIKKKNTTQHATKTRDLVAINDHELDRCRALLHIDHPSSLIPAKTTKKTKKSKKEKNSISSKVKNVTNQAKKKVAAVASKTLPITDKQKSKKVKSTKKNIKSNPNEKKKSINKSSETQSLTPSTPIKQAPIKIQTPSPPPPPPSPPPPPPPPTHTKSKREKPPPPPPVIEEPTETLDINESNDIDDDEKNNSVVGRAYHFVKNMFQLSDDILENNHTHEEDQILSSTNEQQQQHRQSRKLLSINDDTTFIIDNNINDYEFNLYFNEFNDEQSITPSDDLSLFSTSISKRQLLSVKTNKRSIPSKNINTKEKKTNLDANKPKVGWAYRYRISRYLADSKMKRSGRGNKAIGGGKTKLQQNNKKLSSSSNTKVSKRKLLELEIDDETDWINDDISKQDIVNTVSITQDFVPKRQLLAAKKVKKEDEETDDETDIDKINERRRMKSYEELTDPIEIVRSYDRGLFKPRVGWQFRYRVSRYIDSLRENIREDQERLKLGLEAIKRKTPQELSGRRKRVLDKPFAPEQEEIPVPIEDNKPNVGWRYRYRISKMLEAKQRGDYIDDEEEKRKARLEQKRKQPGIVKSTSDDGDDDCLEWEYDLDPELRKIGEEGKRVGWAYRYRIRRKLDEVKQKQAETGIPFDWETLGGKREKKTSTTTPSPTVVSDEKLEDVNKKIVGWQYRYRVSKMLEAQKHEAAEALAKSKSKKQDQVPVHERLDPALARLTPEERVVGWQYRYRIRRKLDAINNATRETEAGKRGKKRKDKEKMIKKVEESIEKILNIDDIDETPFMEYFRRTSSYILFGLVPAARKSICLLPLPVELPFCKEDENKDIKETLTTTAESSKPIPTKKLRTKKEKHAKQFIHSHSTKLDTIAEKINDSVKPSSKTPPRTTIEKPQKKQTRQRSRSSIRHNQNEQIKHFDEEEEPVKKLVGVDSKKKKNKKKFQILGKEVKIKHKHSTTSSTTLSTPVTITNPPPIVTTTPPTIEIPKPISPPPPAPSPTPQIVPTTTHAPLQSISEIIQEEAATLLSTEPTFSDETKEEINEANENLRVKTTTLPDANDDATSSKEDNDSASTDNESDSGDSDNDGNEEDEEKNENFDPLAMKKMKQFYENAKESVHDVFDLKDEKDSS